MTIRQVGPAKYYGYEAVIIYVDDDDPKGQEQEIHLTTKTTIEIDRDTFLLLLEAADYGVEEKTYQLETFGEQDYGEELPQALKRLEQWTEALKAGWIKGAQ